MQKCDQEVQTILKGRVHDQSDNEKIVVVEVIEEETKDDEDEFAWSELSVAEEEYEEDEFHFRPVEGDKLELYNERRVW